MRDRQNGPGGGVAVLSRLTCKTLAEKITSGDFDFAAAAVIQLSGDSAILIIFVYLPSPSSYEVSVDDMEPLIDPIFDSFQPSNPEQQFFSEYGLSPLIRNESTPCDGNNLDNILRDLHTVPLSFEIMGTNDISDHYLIFLNLEIAVQPNASRMALSFTSREEMKLFEKSLIHFTYEPCPSRANLVDFYNYISIFGIVLKLHSLKREKNA